jgi:hypothetical protein
MVDIQQVPFALVDRPDLTPRCPHCGEGIHEVYEKATGVAFGQGRTTIFFCPTCHKVLGFSQGRML